jgi:hypothetical protein
MLSALSTGQSAPKYVFKITRNVFTGDCNGSQPKKKIMKTVDSNMALGKLFTILNKIRQKTKSITPEKAMDEELFMSVLLREDSRSEGPGWDKC